MATKIQIRRDTSSSWTLNNPVLAIGEPGLETDTLIVKYGDGSTAWNNLPYSNVDSLNDFTTSDLSEGTNLYFTNARTYANVINIGYAANTYVNTRLLTKANVSDLTALTTANVSEVTNLYFTNARAQSALSNTNPIFSGVIAGNITIGITNDGTLSFPTLANIQYSENDSRLSRLNYFSATGNTSGLRIKAPVTAFQGHKTSTLTVFNDDDVRNGDFLSIQARDFGDKFRITIANVINNVQDTTNASINFYDHDTRIASINSLGPSANTDLTTKLYIDNSNFAANAYVNTRLATKANVSDLRTANVVELTNLYYTNARVNSYITANTTILSLNNTLILASFTYDNLPTGVPGAIVFETSNNIFRGFNGTSWVALS